MCTQFTVGAPHPSRVPPPGSRAGDGAGFGPLSLVTECVNLHRVPVFSPRSQSEGHRARVRASPTDMLAVLLVVPSLVNRVPHSTARRSALGLGLAAMVPTLRAAADDQAVADDQALPAQKWVPATPMEAFMGPPQPKKAFVSPYAPKEKKAPVYPWDGAKGSLPPIAGVNAPAKGTFSDATKALGLPSFSSYKPPAYASRGTDVRSTSVKPETAPAGVALPKLSGDLTTVLGSVAVLAAAAAPFFLGGAASADREPRADTEGIAPSAAPSAPVQLDALPSWMTRKPRPRADAAQPPAPPAPPTSPPGEDGR